MAHQAVIQERAGARGDVPGGWARWAAAYGDFVTPAMSRPVPETALVLDTSGSVTAPVLERLVGEVTGILDKVSGPRRRLRVLCCDTKAHPGGTDMRAGVEAAMELRPAPDLMIVMTDGEATDWAARVRIPADVEERER